MFLAPCCTAGACEFRAGNALHLASHMARHGWPAAWPGRIEGVNDDGAIVEADGAVRPIRWQGDRESR